ncbi:MAG: exodeoxyribonuclease VII small subunit [Acetobacter sp.]|nr:exodeoxyribonuclease VII small subunit [Acetobacter sp.]
MAEENEDLSNLSFEEALAKLENIVRELESGRIKLDDAVSSYEKAVALKKLCQEKLQAAALKVEKIEIAKDGTLSTTPLEGVEA